MSRLNDIIRHVAHLDPELAKDLRRETDALADRRSFGLNFERHVPEAVELPGRPVRKNDKVRVLPPRGETPKQEHERLWRVDGFSTTDGTKAAALTALDDPDDTCTVAVEDLVVVAEFRDPIYPGLVSTGKVERGGDKPFHTVINAENYHALQALRFTHRGKVDAIYIDPPYNTGARDWKYNNDYVESEDHYRHSKWLAFIERRLLLAKELLNPDDSVLIVTIDEKEYLRLGILLEQVFPEADIQMISSVVNTSGAVRATGFARVDEYIFFVFIGSSAVTRNTRDMLTPDSSTKSLTVWRNLIRDSGSANARADRWRQFYPVFVNVDEGRIVGSGPPIPLGHDRHSVSAPQGTVAVWPIRINGDEGYWQLGQPTFEEYLAKGYVKVGQVRGGRVSLNYLRGGDVARVESGEIATLGRAISGEVLLDVANFQRPQVPKSVWNLPSHVAPIHGSTLLRELLGSGRRFPYPKSLYAVEDALRFFVADKPNASVIDFFSGSGTTAHAVMRLNKQDGGHRRSISITNNEVSADEQRSLREGGLRPGDPDWEQWGICDYITKPRIEAAITGLTPDGTPIKGDYRFTDEFPMADGFKENVEFFTLTYESAMRVSSNREFAKIAPFLWLRAGARGRRIDAIPNGWDVAEAYGVIADLDRAEPFVEAVEAQDGITNAFIITDEDRLFEAMVRQLPGHIEPVRLYSSYLRNFEIEVGRSSR